MLAGFVKRGVMAVTFVIVSAVGLQGCGFQPKHTSSSATSASSTQRGVISARLAAIKVDEIIGDAGLKSRLGQILRGQVLRELQSNGAAPTAYRLSMRYDLEETGLGVREDDAITLVNVKLVAHYDLIDIETDKLLFTGSSRSLVTYDLVQSDYANLAAQQDAHKRLAAEVARQVVTRLGMFLSQMP